MWDRLEGSFASFDLSVSFAGLANVPESEGKDYSNYNNQLI